MPWQPCGRCRIDRSRHRKQMYRCRFFQSAWKLGGRLVVLIRQKFQKIWVRILSIVTQAVVRLTPLGVTLARKTDQPHR